MGAIDDGDKFAEKMRGRAEAILAVADAHDAKVAAELAAVREAAAPIQAEVTAALLADDFSQAAKLYKKMAAHFDEAARLRELARTALSSEANAYRIRAQDCTNTLRRRNWAERHRQGGIKR